MSQVENHTYAIIWHDVTEMLSVINNLHIYVYIVWLLYSIVHMAAYDN